MDCPRHFSSRRYLNLSCGPVCVDVVLEQVGVVRHERPALGEEIRQPGNDLIELHVQARWRSSAQLLEL